MTTKKAKVLSVQKLHTSPRYMKESIDRLNHISDLMGQMIPHIERIRMVNKKWIEHYEKN
jgi:hypothetical protein